MGTARTSRLHPGRALACALSLLAGLAGSAQAATYDPGIGELGFSTFETVPLAERMEMRVNVATGNLMLNANDLRIAGTGVDLGVSRSFNNLEPTGRLGMAGRRQTMSIGDDVHLEIGADGSARFFGPSGYQAPFARQADGSFKAPTGLNMTLVKNADGTFVLTVDKSGQKYRFSSTGALTSQEDLNANKLSLAYTAGQLTSVTDTQGRVTRFDRNSNGTLGFITDPTGRNFSYRYDSNRNLNEFVDPAGKSTLFSYDSSGNLLQVQDSATQRTQMTYDSSRRVLSITRANGAKTSFAYSAGSTVVTDPRANKATYTYDSENRVTKIVDARAKTRTFAYNANSDLTSNTSPNNQGTTRKVGLSYDARNNLTNVAQPAGATSSAKYESTSFPSFTTSATNAQGSKVDFGYDPKGNVASIKGGLAAENQSMLTYNANGTMATSTDANANVTRFGYDPKGNLTSIDRPAPLGDETLAYDALSRLTSSSDGKGQTTTYVYDVLDRRTKSTAADGSSVSYAYDSVGNQTSRTEAAGTTTYSFDSLNRLTRERFPNSTQNDYSYDSANNVTQFEDGGGKVAYAYGATNLLDSETDPAGAKTTFSYDDNGNRTSTVYPNGVTMTERWDSSDQQLEITGKNGAGSVLSSFTYTYRDATSVDRDLRQTVIDKSGAKTTYGYDGLDRLKRALTLSAGGATVSDYTYAYDPNSNRMSQTAPAGTTSYAYNGANELTQAGATTFGYDANGQETSSSAGRTFAYNARNQATSLRPAGAPSSTALGYLGEGQAELTAIGSDVVQNNQAGVGRLTTGGTAYSYTRDNDGRLISQRSTAGTYYYLFDALGSVVAMTDSTGAVKNTYSYDPFGNSTGSSTPVAGNPFQFASGYSTGGLYHFGQRYYDPNLGRWTQQDPLDQIGDLRQGNRYLYVGDDPINNVDPSGTISIGLSASVCVGICVKASVNVGTKGASASVGSGVGVQAGIGGSVSTATPRKSRFKGTVTATGCDGVCGSYDSRGNASVGGVGAGASLTGDVSTGIGY